MKLGEACWRHWKIVSYIVAGDPTLTTLYLNWLVLADEGQHIESYSFSSKTRHVVRHITTGEVVKVDTHACLKYLAERVGSMVNLAYSWIAYQPDAHTKLICQQTRRATTITRPPLEISRRGEPRSSGFQFL